MALQELEDEGVGELIKRYEVVGVGIIASSALGIAWYISTARSNSLNSSLGLAIADRQVG